MKVGLGVLTYNVHQTGRMPDLAQAMGTTEENYCGHPRERILLTNGSTDATATTVKVYGGVVLEECDSRIWYGNTELIKRLSDNDLIVLSADDLHYRRGWLADLVAFVEAIPPKMVMGTLKMDEVPSVPLVSAYMEPIWDWNQPRAVVEYGGQRGLIRDSVCGSSWAFRPSDWEWMGPFPETMPGEDLQICHRVTGRGLSMAALDLAEHVGQERSAWGNQSHLTARPLDRKLWGLE